MIIQGNKVFVAGQFVRAQVEIIDNKISAVLPYGTKEADVDYGDYMILPGFIDVHTHGAYGYSADEGTPEGLIKWLSKLPEEGVTAFLPTTITNRKEVTMAALSNIARVMEQKPDGAQILGAHFEGPFLDNEFRGAQAAALIKVPSIDKFKEFQAAAGGNIKYMTLAPERDSDFELIRYASQNGVVVSIGHSGISNEGALMAIANGVTSFTHSFNGMRGLHHREPGVVGTLMTTNVFAEIIADGYHVHPNVVNILFKAKNNTNLIMITDSVMAKGLGPGIYKRENFDVEVDDGGTARILGTNTIAGGSLKMNNGLKLLTQKAMVSIEHAILAATYYPALALGIERQKGQVLAGADADLTVVDGNFDVMETYCLGKAMLQKNKA